MRKVSELCGPELWSFVFAMDQKPKKDEQKMKKLQTCDVCGWSKTTNAYGLQMHKNMWCKVRETQPQHLDANCDSIFFNIGQI